MPSLIPAMYRPSQGFLSVNGPIVNTISFFIFLLLLFFPPQPGPASPAQTSQTQTTGTTSRLVSLLPGGKPRLHSYPSILVSDRFGDTVLLQL